MKKALVLGAGGFIGNHLVNRLKQEGFWVRGSDIKLPEYSTSLADDFIIGDLRSQIICDQVLNSGFDEVYQLAADMGGAGYIFSGEHDANVMHNSSLINLNILERCISKKVEKIFYSSSACIYPAYNQEDSDNPKCNEDSAYPASPDSEYGWEKLFSERLYMAFHRNYKLDVRIARFHNIFGELGTWKGGREKAPAALCRKIAETPDGGEIEVWGDGKQTRSFLYVSECIDGILRLMKSDITIPLNIGSEEMVSVNELAKIIITISGKKIGIKNVSGLQGVRGRNSDNKLIEKLLGWKPTKSLKSGLETTYGWISNQIKIECDIKI